VSLFEWSVQAWRRPGVEAAALERQDRMGESIALILWRAWAGSVDEAVYARAQALADSFEADVIAPIRQARRALRASREGFPSLETLREEMRVVELAAERRLLAALERLAPEAGSDAETAWTRLDKGLGL
jgi:uncharacterized protein (TIGR02444 family)